MLQKRNILLSIGNFAITKKLFSYSHNDKNVLPIFTSVRKADTFATKIIEYFKKEHNLEYDLVVQICEDDSKLADILQMIAIFNGIRYVAINPSPPTTTKSISHKLLDVSEFVSGLSENGT